MKIRSRLILVPIIIMIFSCKPKTTDNLEEMARRSSRPEAVLVKTVKLEPSVFYHELISNGKVHASQKAVVPFKVNGIIRELFIRNGQQVNAGDLLAVMDDFDSIHYPENNHNRLGVIVTKGITVEKAIKTANTVLEQMEIIIQ